MVGLVPSDYEAQMRTSEDLGFDCSISVVNWGFLCSNSDVRLGFGMVCPISVVRVCFIRIQMFGLALVCVEVDEDKISVFDTGPGMDGSDEKSIVKWGKMGASVHRSTKKLAVGGKPPFLTVFA
ncbi:uncharacterized protein [Spinacia oleracea]|uniref:Uncharacterized protein isoform X2 n=2 Tax=Spinacia oleracea TaxID=3562 RepID=A0ABM3R1E1_SPIOL|nr:uncharacterized protein LOC110802765 isoform X2 [Spinacia oleracea]